MGEVPKRGASGGGRGTGGPRQGGTAAACPPGGRCGGGAPWTPGRRRRRRATATRDRWGHRSRRRWGRSADHVLLGNSYVDSCRLLTVGRLVGSPKMLAMTNLEFEIRENGIRLINSPTTLIQTHCIRCLMTVVLVLCSLHQRIPDHKRRHVLKPHQK